MGFIRAMLLNYAGVIIFILCFAALFYLPFMMVKRRKGGKLPVLQHLARYAFVAYLLLLIYIVFLYNLPFSVHSLSFEESGHALRHINMRPFAELYAAMFERHGILGSQLTMNVLLFMPLGFLLPLVYPNKFNRFWRVALCALFTTVAIEFTQYFIGRSADIDDVIANALGGMLGYCVLQLCDSLFHKRSWWGKLCLAALPRAAWRTACAGFALVAAVAVPAAVDAANTRTPYGLVRYATSGLPNNLTIDVALSDAAGEMPLYAFTADYQQTLLNILQTLALNLKAKRCCRPMPGAAHRIPMTQYM